MRSKTPITNTGPAYGRPSDVAAKNTKAGPAPTASPDTLRRALDPTSETPTSKTTGPSKIQPSDTRLNATSTPTTT
jgi:hypothetical protein